MHEVAPRADLGVSLSRYRDFMAEPRTVTVPVVVERDEDGVWCAHAQLRPGVGAHGEGDTEEAALDDLRQALVGLIEEFGVPRELSRCMATAISPRALCEASSAMSA
jgi:predicted RNase H-like HicB family nuclease